MLCVPSEYVILVRCEATIESVSSAQYLEAGGIMKTSSERNGGLVELDGCETQ